MRIAPLYAGGYRSRDRVTNIWADAPLTCLLAVLCIFGLIMVTSASMEFADRRYGDALHFLKRQGVFLLLALAAAVIVYWRPSELWFRNSFHLLLFCAALLIAVLIPEIGKEVNGSRRWLDFKVFTVQPSEAAKLAVIVFLADYVARRREEVGATFKGFFKPLLVVTFLALLVFLEPDYGVSVILLAIAFSMLFLAGAKLGQSLLLLVVTGGVMMLAAVAAPYRWARIKAFLDPWSDPLESGYQLTQSLIAVGSGGWFGQGLGASVQKLFYLPEAHTDFIFAVIAEELGFVGVCLVVIAYFGVVWRCFVVAARAERMRIYAGAFFAYGVGVWVGIQAFVNVAVVVGLLPTKGITLPLISVGGSSLVVLAVAFAIVQRIHYESCCADAVLMRRYRSERNRAGR